MAVVILFAATFWLAQEMHRGAVRDRLVGAAAQEAAYTFSNLEDRLLFIAEHLRTAKPLGPSPEQEDFSSIAHHLFRPNDFLVAINYIGPDYRIRCTYPLEENRELVGLKIAIRQPKQTLERAVSSGDPRLSAPFEIIQGQTGYSLMVPSGETGFYEVVFLAGEVFGKTSRFRRRKDIAVSIWDGNVLAYESPSHRRLTKNASTSTTSRKVSLLNRELTFNAVAIPELAGKAALFWKVLSGASVSLVIVLLGAVVVSQMRWRRQYEAMLKRLRKSEKWHYQLFETSRDAIMTLDPISRQFMSANTAALRIFGAADEDEFTTLSPSDLSPPRQPDGTPSAEKVEEVIETAAQKGSHFFEWTHCRLNGEEFPATVLLSIMPLEDRRIFQATVRDITERKRAEQELEKVNAKLAELSVTDELTGLPNRRQLNQKIAAEITRSKRTGHLFAVLMLDLDNFKHVNDQYGHQKGDEVLQQLAEIIRQKVRGMDLPTRFGGEEFCVLLPETDSDEARNSGEKIRRAVEALPDPAPTVSVGVACWKPGMSSEEVVSRADKALYSAKLAGRNCVVTYVEQPDGSDQNLRHTE